MCGIAGIFLSGGSLDADTLRKTAQHMGNALAARGPDDHDIWVDASRGIALAHRRLSIIDLSPEGHQPMASASGRYIVSYNGEIYNYHELRSKLDYPWRGQSDTEVLLAAIEAWGIEKSLQAINGMFAFAVWDNQEKTLTLARDRMGEKPLYYGWVGTQFVFASELKAFSDLSGWPPALNRNALHLLMRYSYIPAPHSIYESIHQLEPASFLSISTAQKEVTAKPYWSLAEMVATSSTQRFTSNTQELTEQLEALLKSVVGQRMMADVPLGAFLSGGIDSSLIAAMMQTQSNRPIKTFTIGFSESGFDEAPYAKAVARHLGTDHTEAYISPREAAEVIPLLSHIYDEPFADASQIPTYLVSKFARQHVTVALSGDGGDELFGGYHRYLKGPALWNSLSPVPAGLRKLVAHGLLATHRGFIQHFGPTTTSRIHRLLRKLGNYYEKMDARSSTDFYYRLCSVYNHPSSIVFGGHESPPDYAGASLNLPYAEWMMMQDALTYFPGDILAKVDRAAMAVSLETRTPFTDPDLMEFAWRLPLHQKIHQGKGKWLLRQVLYRHVPAALIERPKSGFAVPIGTWLRGELKNWAEDLLAPNLLKQQGYLNETNVHRLWQQHQSGSMDHEKALWNILMFQSWLSSRSC